MRLLIENGADINAVNVLNHSALICAISEGMENVKLCYVTCKKREFHGRQHVMFLGNDKIAEYLIQNGADVNVMGHRNATALTSAAEKGKK